MSSAGAGSPSHEKALDEALHARRKHLAPSFSTHYSCPLLITKARGCFLFDSRGQPFLDVVNNPAGVGHCHPMVVKAAADQMGKLNTNTRYLYPELSEYASALCATLPEGLDVCYFVNSGSEANDLALRIARWHTQQEDIVCLEGGYHGHTDALIAISPYKLAKAKRREVPITTHTVEAPDAYRSPRADGDYAAPVATAVEGIVGKGRKPAAFFCEGALSCAGYLPLPPGYLEGAYRAVRGAGGLCVSDEVQSGFGRAGGGRMWAFEHGGVVPDIVTMGKPMGNGFPLAAVVTTKEIAGSFVGCGMEYFNTFGGGPVACRVGLAVLQAIQTDKILEHVDTVGRSLMQSLRELSRKHDIIGDVRGHGLFIGVELVRDRGTREPANTEADWVCEALRCRGVLINSDGIHGNVFKIKPPLCMSQAHVELLVAALDEVLDAMPTSSSGLRAPHKEVPSALQRVHRVVEQHGVGAGPSWANWRDMDAGVGGNVTYSLQLGASSGGVLGMVGGVLLGVTLVVMLGGRRR